MTYWYSHIRLPLWGIGFLLVLWVFPSRVLAQEDALRQRFQQALLDGDAQTLMADAADQVEMFVLESSQLYSRAQATYVMQNFFHAYPPKAFVLKQASRKDHNWFVLGLYHSSRTDQQIQIYVHYRLKENRWELREIRIDMDR